MQDLFIFIIGVICAGAGGELFVRGTVDLGNLARISPAILATTVAAFATSSPELSVSIGAALSGNPAVGLGDVLGSNVINIALILGITLTWSSKGLPAPSRKLWQDYATALFTPVLTGFFISDGLLSRVEGIVLLVVFFLWMTATVIEALRERPEPASRPLDESAGRVLLLLAAGLILLIAAGEMVVMGARGMASRAGIDEFIIGAVIVSFGTSTPELATAVVSRLRGHDEVGFGTILGSNMMNGLLIAGLASTITPIRLAPFEVGTVLLFGFICLLPVFPVATGRIGRLRAVVLLLIYLIWNLVMIRIA
jgi:cation:H+ antiporter